MGELMEINLVMQNDTPVVSSIQISENFNKQHGHVLRDIDNLKKDVSNFGEIFFETTIKDTYNRDQRAYLMNRDGFSLLAMGFSGKAALEWKVKYISAFNAMEKVWNSPEMVMARSLQFAAKQIDGYKEKLHLAERTIEQQKPQVLFAESVTASSTSILVADLAKILKKNGVEIGELRLWEWLRNNRYVIKEKGRSYNMPTQKAMNLKVMEVKEGTYINSKGESKITKTTLITGKGQVYFVNKFLKSREENLCLSR